MSEQLNYAEASPQGVGAVCVLEVHARHSGLNYRLFELAETCASQSNGCAFHFDRHTKDARGPGEETRRPS